MEGEGSLGGMRWCVVVGRFSLMEFGGWVVGWRVVDLWYVVLVVWSLGGDFEFASSEIDDFHFSCEMVVCAWEEGSSTG